MDEALELARAAYWVGLITCCLLAFVLGQAFVRSLW